MPDTAPPRLRSADSAGIRFFENLAYLVPGYRGYKEKELRRDEDARLRSRVLAKLQILRSGLEDRISRLGENPTSPGEAFSQRLARLEAIAHSVRYAPYGFSGFFDVEKVREETLEKVLECDLLIFQELDDAAEQVADSSLQLRSKAALSRFLESLDERIDQIETRLLTRDKVLGDR